MRGLFLKIIFFIGLLSSSANLFSQSFYELRFNDAYGNEYVGFWVYISESESYMRMAYYNADNEYRVVHVDYIAETGMTEDGVYYFVLFGENPVFITDYYEDESYNPDTFVWVRYENEEYGKPFVTDDPDFGDDSFIEVNSYIELDPSQFNEEYLNQFYGTAEPDYIALMSMVDDGNSQLANQTNVNHHNSNNTSENNNGNNATFSGPVTMHLVIAANTDIGDIGKSCEVDERNLISEFEGICEVLGINLKQYLIHGKEFTKENLVNTINGISAGSNDIVMFVYTGHGFRWSDQSGQFPQLDMRHNAYMRIEEKNSINLSEVNDMLLAKGARLNICFGDCCNSDVGVNQRTSNTFLASRNNGNYKLKNLQRLFIESSGNVLATAASPGQVSWSNSVNGGFFLSSFFQAFREEIGYLEQDATWDDMMKKTIEYAEYKTSKDACSNCSTQNGQKSVSISYN